MSKDGTNIPDKALEKLLPVLASDAGRSLMSNYSGTDFIDLTESYITRTTKAMQDNILAATSSDTGFRYETLGKAFGLPVGLSDRTNETKSNAEKASRLNVRPEITPDGTVFFASTDKQDQRAVDIARDLQTKHAERLKYLIKIRQARTGEDAKVALANILEHGTLHSVSSGS